MPVVAVNHLIAVGVDELATQLAGAWCHETSADPARWSPSNKAWGQCAVTALVVQDRFGGTLLRAEVQGLSHYWNRLPDGSEVDLTARQFEPGVLIEDGDVRERSYVLSFGETRRRYDLLERRLRDTH
jgi:hypothetical protein